ncbi:GNAT family N-acetyltransferase [Geothrix edaphica]|uniref:N-acetyltransferase n=1 Tax=Geothrix edaphica TaxID=2927976 RepID=A0ABQ5PWA8_9BACT|nr:GNAT family N-acetyltransferase [Geothrix edaphica]GLH66757.1 N-acetyltransferase [Geothrix edaphica]
MSTITIRPAAPEDAPILAELGARTFRETFEPHTAGPDLEAFLTAAYGEAIQRAELADPARPARILEVDGVPVGFLQLRLGHREPGVPGEHPVELQRIYVLRAAQGGGRGAALMAEAVEMARAWGADVLWLGVWENNLKALAFYARTGFREVGDHVFQIGDQVDRDLILARDLT